MGETLLLSAGPRAGKTRLLAQWDASLPEPKAFMSLTPEDAEAEFFRYRLFQPWPEIRDRYEALAARIPASWGALLGRAIAEAHPDFSLLVDDLHVVEETPLLPELLALFRHFPPKGRLAIASRHGFPPLTGRASTRIGPDHPCWQERPEPEDLLQLPSNLRATALAIHLLGDAAPSLEGQELVRRNIAMLDEGMQLQLRAPWSVAADGALALAPPDGLGEALERHVEAFHERHVRTAREQRLQEALDRIPRSVWEQRPYFLQLKGDLLLAAGRVEEARITYQQALNQAQDLPERHVDLLIGLAKVARRTSDLAECRSLLERIETLTPEPTPLQKAAIDNELGYVHWVSGEPEAAKAAFERVAGNPATGDRQLAYQRVMAHSCLIKLLGDLGEAKKADRQLQQAIALVTEYGFQRDLLAIHTARLTNAMVSETQGIPIREIADLPNACFVYPSPIACFNLLYTLGTRALYLDEPALAVRYVNLAKRFATSHELTRFIGTCDIQLLNAYRALRRYQDAKQLYSELTQTLVLGAERSLIQICWALILVESQQYREAEALLEEMLANPHPEYVRAYGLFIPLYARHLRGAPGALAEIRSLLDSPEGPMLWQHEQHLLQKLGLRNLPPRFRVHAFGPLSLQRDDQPSLPSAKKKPLSFLGHMVLHPEGITSERLAEEIFGDPEALEALHSTAYRLRQGLKEIEASNLLEALRGTYRLRGEQIAYCDLHEFDALHGKAQALEKDGIPQGAALFYEMALQVVQGPLFENLPQEFEAARSRYDRRVQHARNFLQAHRVLGISAPSTRPEFG